MVTTQRPLVSVIVPVYNGDRYIVQAIESILNQSYPNYEIIVVDDGSTNNTRNFLQLYWQKIRYFYQDNQGMAAARNRGISEGKGKLIAFLDRDDLFLPHKLVLQVACYETKPSLGIVNSGW